MSASDDMDALLNQKPPNRYAALRLRFTVPGLALAFLLSISLFGFAAIYLAVQSLRFASAGPVAAGAISGAALPGVLVWFTYLATRLPGGRLSGAISSLAWGGFIVWLLALIIFAAYERSGSEPPIMGRGFGHAYAAGSFAFFFGLLVVLGVRRWLRGPVHTPAETVDRDVGAHRVTVNHVAARGIEPYYVTICGCGWVGLARSASEEAFAEARSHSPDVAPGIEEPRTWQPG